MLWRVSWSRQAVAIKDSVDFVRAGKSIGMSSHFADQVAAMGTDGAHPNNYERDFLAFARRDLGVDFQLYDVNCIVRKRGQAAVNMDIGFLLPYEVAHWLWMFNPDNLRCSSIRRELLSSGRRPSRGTKSGGDNILLEKQSLQRQTGPTICRFNFSAMTVVFERRGL